MCAYEIILGDDLPARIQERLSRPLPGRNAMKEFAPELSYGRQYGPPCYDVKQAAVIALVYPIQGMWHLLMTVRSVHVAEHASQISLPGGALEGDESHRDAALRELQEELGFATLHVKVVGQLTPVYLFVSNYLVIPWVGFMAQRPSFQPNPREVAGILEMPLTALLDNALRGWDRMERDMLAFHAPRISWNGHRIWGGTAMILGEMIWVLEQAGNEPART